MITKNTLIRFNVLESAEPIIHRVLMINQELNVIITINIFDEKAWPEIHDYDEIASMLIENSTQIIPEEPFAKKLALKESDLSPKQSRNRDKAYSTIEILILEHEVELFQKSKRGKLVKKAAQDFNCTETDIRRRLRRYWQRGMVINALIPDYENSGAPGQSKPASGRKRGRKSSLEKVEGNSIGVNITEATAKIIQRCYKRFHLEKGMSEKLAFIEMLGKFFASGYAPNSNRDIEPILLPAEKLPTLTQFRYWGKRDLSRSEISRKRFRDNYLTDHRPLTSSSMALAYGPGSVFQIDATIGDIYLISTRNRYRIIGRPIIYIIRDTWSRMIAGFHVGLEGPSWQGAMLALDTLIADKVTLCAKYGVSIEAGDWPCHFLPQQIIADRGELLSLNALEMVRGLGITKSNTPPYRGDLKSLVEGYFNIINNELLDFLPGDIHKFAPRSGRDYRLDATLNINEFTGLLIKLILHQNNETYIENYQREAGMYADNIDCYPLDIWNWGLENRSGLLRQMEPSVVRRHLLPEAQGSISREGIYFKKLFYTTTDSRLSDIIHKAKRGRIAVRVVYDPRSVNEVFVKLNDRADMIPIKLRSDYEVYEGISFLEYEDERAVHAQAKQQLRHRQYSARLNFQNEIENTVKRVVEEKSSLPQPQSKKIHKSDININRREEKIRLQKGGAWVETGPEIDPNNLDEAFTDEAVYQPKHDPFESIEAVQQKLKQAKDRAEKQ